MSFPSTRADTLEYIAAYNKERNEMLLKLSPLALREFQIKWGLPVNSSVAVGMITLHKTITGVDTLPKEFRQASFKWLPKEFRQASFKWLTERGYETWDDGDLR